MICMVDVNTVPVVCSSQSEPGDVHPLRSNLEDRIPCRFCGHSDRIRTHTFQRERPVHIHVLCVAAAVHIDRVTALCAIHSRLYRRGVGRECAAFVPPARFVGVELRCVCHARECSDQCKYEYNSGLFCHNIPSFWFL